MVAVAGGHGRRGGRSRHPVRRRRSASARAVSPKSIDDLPPSWRPRTWRSAPRSSTADGNVIATLYDENRINVPLVADLADHAQGDRRDRGLPLLPARRARPEGHPARPGHQPGQQRRRPGWLVDHPADGEADAASTRPTTAKERRGGHRRHLRPQAPASCATRSPSSRTTPRTGSSSATSTSPTSATAPTASRRRPSTTSHQRQGPQPPQSAMLAGLVKNPSGYDPTNSPDRPWPGATSSSTGWPSSTSSPRSKADKLKEQGLGLDPSTPDNGCVNSTAPFFCDYVVSYLMQDPPARQDRRGAQEPAPLRRPDDPDDDRPARCSGRPTPPCSPTSSRPTAPSAGWRWSSRAPATCGRWRSRGRWAATRQAGQTFLNYVVPQQVRRLERLPGRLDVQGRSCSPPRSSRASRSTRRSTRRRRLVLRKADFLDCDGLPYDYGEWPRELHDVGLQGHVHRHPRVGEHLLRPARAGDRPVRARSPLAKDMGIELTSPNGRRRGRRAGRRRSRSASPTPARWRWPRRTPPSPAAACTAPHARSPRSRTRRATRS